MKFTVQAHAKINWSLGVLGRRADGYHDLDMLMQPLALSDELVFESSRWLSLSVDGAPAPSGEKNLVLRAASLLCDATGKQRGARITLVKRIPTRAGLGGGSADCAAALLALNRLWNLKLSMRSLLALGARLGADVPFCLSGGLAHVGGLGEKITALPGAPSIPLAMVTPGGGLSTPAVFREFDDGGDPFGALDASALAAALCAGDLDRAQSLSLNSLEPAAIRLMPEIGEAMRRFRELGARFVRMTGSGSTVFAAFETPGQAAHAAAQVEGAIATCSLGEGQS